MSQQGLKSENAVHPGLCSQAQDHWWCVTCAPVVCHLCTHRQGEPLDPAEPGSPEHGAVCFAIEAVTLYIFDKLPHEPKGVRVQDSGAHTCQ